MATRNIVETNSLSAENLIVIVTSEFVETDELDAGVRVYGGGMAS